MPAQSWPRDVIYIRRRMVKCLRPTRVAKRDPEGKFRVGLADGGGRAKHDRRGVAGEGLAGGCQGCPGGFDHRPEVVLVTNGQIT